MFFNKKMAIFSLAIFFITLDRFLKIFALSVLQNKTIYIINDVLQFQFAKNYYIAFSLPLSGKILNIFIILIIFVLIFLIKKEILKKENYQFFILIFITLGAISNLYDRIVYGYVIDYIYLKYFTIFNVADMLITLPTSYFITKELFKKTNN